MNEPPPPSLATLIQFIVHESHTSITNLAKEIQQQQLQLQQQQQQSSSITQESALQQQQQQQQQQQLELEQRKRIHDTLQVNMERYMRLLVLIRWIKSQKAQFDSLDEFRSSLLNVSFSMQFSADRLMELDPLLKQLRLQSYDLSTAIDVLTTGTYKRLPQIKPDTLTVKSKELYKDASSQLKQKPQQQQASSSSSSLPAIERLNDLIRMKLLQSTIPDAMRVVRIEHGQVILSVPNEFLLILTLRYDDQFYDELKRKWRQSILLPSRKSRSEETNVEEDVNMESNVEKHNDKKDKNDKNDKNDESDENESEEEKEEWRRLMQVEKDKKSAFIWHITHLQLFVNESGVTVSPLSHGSWYRLYTVLQRRLHYRLSSEPLVDLYHRLHGICVRLVADVMSKQGYQLQWNQQWKNCSIMYDVLLSGPPMTTATVTTPTGDQASSSSTMTEATTSTMTAASSASAGASAGGLYSNEEELSFVIKYWQNAPNVNRLITPSSLSSSSMSSYQKTPTKHNGKSGSGGGQPWYLSSKFIINKSHFIESGLGMDATTVIDTMLHGGPRSISGTSGTSDKYAGELRFYVDLQRQFQIEHRSNLSLICKQMRHSLSDHGAMNGNGGEEEDDDGKDLSENNNNKNESGALNKQFNWAKMDLSQLLTNAMNHHMISIMEIVYEYLRSEVNFHLPVQLVYHRHQQQQPHNHNSIVTLQVQLFEKYVLEMGIDWRSGKFLLCIKKDHYPVRFNLTEVSDIINNYEKTVLSMSQQQQQPTYGSVIVQCIEKVRKSIIIHAYEQASNLLGLDTFHYLPGASTPRDMKYPVLYIRSPTCPHVFISIKPNSSTHDRRKPVSCRIIFQTSPKIVERKISDLVKPSSSSIMSHHHQQQNGNGHLTEEESASEKKQKKKDKNRDELNSPEHLTALKHLKLITEKYRTSIERYLIVSELESREGINFHMI